jgi:cytochrome d ubiquinol oxidase subunit I
MDFDVLTLSRIQFALTIMFHYIFPPLSIGLGTLMVLMEGRYLWTGDPQYQRMTKFWTKIFAANFAMGVATGIVMEFQFGTNWAHYSRFVGDVFGSALAAEGIFAFFLESGFLAVLVFGWDRVSSRMHFIATVMVALGAMFSSVWIVVANSWQQTPAGFIIRDGRAEITDFWAMVFNPSSMDRLIHVLLGSFIQGAFFVMSIAAFYILLNRYQEFARKSFTLALIFGTGSSLAMGLSGHTQARKVAHTQPAKLAAFEGHFKTQSGGTGMYLAGWPDPEEERVRHGIQVPGLLSFLVYDDFNQPMQALDQTPPEDRPPVVVPFLTYHFMAGVGGVLIVLTLFALWLLWRGKLFEKRWLMWVFVVAVVGPYLANQAGWVAAETGRQPWIVYGHLRTADGLSKSVVADQVLGSIVMFGFIYLLLFAIWVFVLDRKIRHGPEEPEEAPAVTTAEGLVEAVGTLPKLTRHSLTLDDDEASNR